MKTTLVKASATLVAAVTLSVAAVGGAYAAGPTATQEDPTCTTTASCTPADNGYLVGTGSDTIQDLMYGVSRDLGTMPAIAPSATGQQALTSWTATGTGNFVTRSGVTVVPGTPGAGQAQRPNGSGFGYKALLDSIGATSGVSGFNIGDVDFGRASGKQGTPVAGGVTTDVPFAIDAISFAVPKNSPFLLTNSGKGLQLADLYKIYDGTYNEINTSTGALGTEAVPGTLDAGNEAIQAFLPKPGSGSRQFFLAQLAANDSAGINLNSNGTKGDGLYTSGTVGNSTSTYADGKPYIGALLPGTNADAGQPVQEHDATVLKDAATEATPVAAIAPFSVAKFIGYHNGIIADPSGLVAGTDYQLVGFDSNVSGAVNPVMPYTGDASTGATLAPNSDYKTYGKNNAATTGEANAASLTREVFNIIPTQSYLRYGTPAFTLKDQVVVDTFVGGGSKICRDIDTIKAYGFLPDPNCGSTSLQMGTAANVAGYSAVSITESNTAAVAGKSSVVTFSVASTGNKGGTLSVTINGKVYTGVVPAGAAGDASEKVSFNVPTPTAGTISYGNGATDQFVPNLEGVATTSAPTGTISVAKATATITATSLKISHTSTGGYTVVRVTAPGLTATGNVAVQLKTSTGVLKYSFTARALSSGAVKYLFSRTLAPGNYVVWVAYTGNGNINGKTYTKTAAVISVY